MGNEKSIPYGLKLKDVINVTDVWVQKSATLANGSTEICVFEQLLEDEHVQALKNFSKNLMLFRHPYILKYISSWRKKRTLYVATEFGKPLSLLVKDLLPMQICIGLYNILKAVIFLHEMALSSHNNLSKDAIYVTQDGCWKLGRLELMTSRKQGNDQVNLSKNADSKGFADLAKELLGNIINCDLPAVEDFKAFCNVPTNVIHPAFFQNLISHKFFAHDFIRIYDFLSDLPIKDENAKSVFFETLADDLAAFPEEVTASLLGNLLLSRIVILNTAAQGCLLPRIFSPKSDENSNLFSLTSLQLYFVPKILSMFCVRDSQIRLILLRFFSSFICICSKEQLQFTILPELLVGIKDTNEILVSTTLHALADLVPVLGASIVIGKGRVKLFADGRPFLKQEIPLDDIHEKYESPVVPGTIESPYNLPERLSPDGGEDFSEAVPLPEDLECDIQNINVTDQKTTIEKILHDEVPTKSCMSSLKLNTESLSEGKIRREIIYPAVLSPEEDDLRALDVKCSSAKISSQFDDIDLMFKAMEPVISKTAIVKIPDIVSTEINRNKFKAHEFDASDFGGWGEDAEEWVDPDAD